MRFFIIKLFLYNKMTLYKIYAWIVSGVFAMSLFLIFPILKSTRSADTVNDMKNFYTGLVISGIISLILAWRLERITGDIEKAKKYNEDNAEEIEKKTKTRDSNADKDVVGLAIASVIVTLGMVLCIIEIFKLLNS
jgi:hypothetical protein